MPTLLQALGLLLPPTLVGCAALYALGIRFRSDRLAYFGWAWMLGALGTGCVVFLWCCTGLSLAGSWLIPAELLLAAGLVVVGRSRAGRARRESTDGEVSVSAFQSAPAWERAVFAAVFLAVFAWGLGWIVASTQVPVMQGDEAGVWNIRAKLIYDAGGFGEAFVQEMGRSPRFPVHKDYPLLNPLLQVRAFAVAGGIVQTFVRLPVQALYLALLLVLGSALVRRVRPGVAALLLLMYLGLPQTFEQFGETKADHLVALGLLVLLDCLARWWQSGETRWWALGCLGGALVVASKHEGMPYLFAVALAFALASPRVLAGALAHRARLLWAVLPFAVLGGVWGFNRWFGFTNTVRHAKWVGGPGFFERLATEWRARLELVLGTYRDEVLFSGRGSNYLYLVFFVLLGVLLLVQLRRRLGLRTADLSFAGALRVQALALVLCMASLVVIYLGTTYDVAWHLATSGSRTAHQLLPAIMLWIAGVLGGQPNSAVEDGLPRATART